MQSQKVKEDLHILNMYPSLRDDVVLRLSPNNSVILVGKSNKMIKASQIVINILSKCDGTKNFDEIFSEYFDTKEKDDYIICKSLIDVTNLIKEGLIILNAANTKFEIKTKGSLSIFYPMHIQIELTASCNLKCFYCYRDSCKAREEKRLETNKLLEIIDDLYQNGLQIIELTGGEPTIHPDFFKILKFCSERFSLIAILTNGTLINEQFISDLLPYKEKVFLSISLDCCIPEIHDKRRGMMGAFEKTCTGIRLLSKNKFITRVSMVVDEENSNYVEQTLLLSKELGANSFAYTPTLPFGRASTNFKFRKDNMMEDFKKEKKLQAKYKGYIHLLEDDMCASLKEPGSCGAGHRCYAMDPKGNVRPCVTFNENIAVFGSLAKSSAKEVFSNPLIQYFYKIKAPNQEICGYCKWLLFCTGCNLRGLTISNSNPECKWIKQKDLQNWKKLVEKNTLLLQL